MGYSMNKAKWLTKLNIGRAPPFSRCHYLCRMVVILKTWLDLAFTYFQVSQYIRLLSIVYQIFDVNLKLYKGVRYTMNSLERVPFSASYSGEAGTSLQTRNKLVQHLVIELNGISYYVRNRVEVIVDNITLLMLFGANDCSVFFPLTCNRVVLQNQQ